MRHVGHLREEAKQDLLERLAQGPRATGELRGRLHGGPPLSLSQVRTLLRRAGNVSERTMGVGMRTTTQWSLEEAPITEPDPSADVAVAGQTQTERWS